MRWNKFQEEFIPAQGDGIVWAIKVVAKINPFARKPCLFLTCLCYIYIQRLAQTHYGRENLARTQIP
ncbi:MAG: hypothetical protein A2007_02915 [Verrucomicrobia bacterium GWC2_42_7]|nr:MAG: hypothetical protein A2007_02915 [Verrucomicrobia bacterium GWC2_42_7]